MNKFSYWAILVILVIVVLGSALHNHYVLDSRKLDSAIKTELPPGTPKAQVIQFIQARKPLFWDDLGTHVKARITGRAGNLIYRKDIVLDFEFDPSGRLLSLLKKEYLTFL
jgi:hypothetical protein